jgi:hypothetical protein
VIDGGDPRWPVAHRTGGKGGGGVRGYGALCMRRKSKNESGRSWRRSWAEEKKPRRVARVLAMAAASWRPSSAPGSRGTRRDGQQRGGDAWRRGEAGGGSGGAAAAAQRRQGVLCAGGREEQKVLEEEEGGGGGFRGTNLEKQKIQGTQM